MSDLNKIVANFSSSDRVRGSSSNDFTINFGSSIKRATSVSVLSCELPNTIYNITNLNNQLTTDLIHQDGSEFIMFFTGSGQTTLNLSFKIVQVETNVSSLNETAWLTKFEEKKLEYLDTAYLNSIFPTWEGTLNYPITNGYKITSINTFLNDLKALFSSQSLSQSYLGINYNNETREFSFYYADASGSLQKGYVIVFQNPTQNTLINFIGMRGMSSSAGVYVNLKYLSVSPLKKTVRLSPRNYNYTQFITGLQDALNASYADYINYLGINPFVVSMDASTYKVSFQCNPKGLYDPAYKVKLYASESNMTDVLGMHKQNKYEGNPLTSDGIVDLRGIHTIYIHSSCASTFNISPDGRSDYLLLKMQVDKPFSDTLFYKSYDVMLERFPVSPDNDLSSIWFRVCDQYGQTIDLNGADWSMSLLIYF